MTAPAQNRLTPPVAIGIVASVVVIIAALGVIIARTNESDTPFPIPGDTGTTTTRDTGTAAGPGTTTGTGTTGPGTTRGPVTGDVRTVNLTLGDATVKIVQPSGYGSIRIGKGIKLTNGKVNVYLFLIQRPAGTTAVAALQDDADLLLRSPSFSQVQRGTLTEMTLIGSLTGRAAQSYRGVWTPTGGTASKESGLFAAGVKANGLTLHAHVYGEPGALEADTTWAGIYAQAYVDFANS